MEHYWGKDMSETRSPLYNIYGIKEPINTISALIGILFVLLYNINSNIALKLCIITNLVCAAIAHGSYNDVAIELDGLTLALPILYIFINYKWFIELIIMFLLICILCEFMRPRISMIFAIGLLILAFKKYDDIISINNFILGVTICLFAAICRILDEMYKEYWFFYLHAIWHLVMTIGLVILIDSLKW